MRRLLSIIVLNEHGVLARISGLFAGRGYNIHSISAAPIAGEEFERDFGRKFHSGEFTRINIVTSGDERVFEQICKQVNKLIPIYKVIVSENFIEKELAIIKIPLNQNLGGLDTILRSYNGVISNSDENHLFIMAADDTARIENFIRTMKKYSPASMVRSGSVMLEFK